MTSPTPAQIEAADRQYPSWAAYTRDQMDAAVAATIERCAQVAETFEISNTPEAWSLEGVRRGIAAAIRKLKDK